MNLLIKLKRWLYLLTRYRYALALDRSGIFAERWYAEECCGIRPHAGFLLYHYIRYGRGAGKAPHPLFDLDWYRANYGLPDAMDPVSHYLDRLEQGVPTFPNATLGAISRLKRGSEFATGFSFRSFPPLRSNRLPVTLRQSFDTTLETDFLRDLPHLAPDQRPLVSIIMPTWNRARLLNAAIASVLAQTYQDWELIVVDDGSTDDTAGILRRLGDVRIRTFSMSHTGAAAARNEGIARATGVYIAYLDSDNRWRPHFLDTMVRFLADRQLDAAYCAIHYHGTDGSGYIGRPMCIDDLSWMNFIDLNAFIHLRSLADRLGGFDTVLRRMIDWDLVLRYARAGRIEFAPCVGLDYDASERADRISLSESINWYNVVIGKDRLDWGKLRSASCDRSSSLLSVIVVVGDKRECDALDSCLESIFGGDAGEVEVIVVDNQTDTAVSSRIALWESAFPSIRHLRNRSQLGISLSLNLGFRTSKGARVVFMRQPAYLAADALPCVRTALAAPQAAAIQGKILQANGAIHDAGGMFVAGSRMVSPLYRGFCEDDAVVSRPRPLAALTASFMAVDADSFIDVRGFDNVLVEECFDWDISLRLRSAGVQCGYQPAVSVRLTVDSTHSVNHWDRKLFGERREDAIAGTAPPAPEDGPYITDFALDSLPYGRQDLAVFLPIAYRRDMSVRAPEIHLGIGIHIASPRQGREQWGDYHFAASLAVSLEDLGYDAEIVYADDVAPPTHAVRLVLRGLTRVDPQPDSLNLLWIISHPDEVQVAELKSFDHVFAASPAYTARFEALLGDRISTLLQCTDPRYFNPYVAPVVPGEDILFVGNSRGVRRDAIAMSLAAGIEPSIYGSGWERLVPPRIIRGRFIPNSQLGMNYRASAVVLNDHWHDMAREGFISNRVFDVLACAGILVTDRIPGLEDLFGDACLTYTDRDSLLGAVREAKRDPVVRREKAIRAAQRILREHTFAMRAREIHSVIQHAVSENLRSKD